MKTKKLTLILLGIVVLFSQYSFAQEEKETISDYVELYRKAKNTNDLIKSYSYFEKQKESYLSQEYYIGVVFSLIHISTIENKLNQLFDSENSAVEGLEYLDKLTQNTLTIDYRTQLSNRLGNVMMELEGYEKAIEYYTDVIKYTTRGEDNIIAYNNIGTAYKNLNKLRIAKENFLTAQKLVEKSEDIYKVSLVLSNLGSVRALLGEEEGLIEMYKALEIRIASNDSQLFETYKYLTDYYLVNKDTIKALKYAEKGYESTKKVGNLLYSEEALSSLIKLGQDEFAKEYNDIVEKVKENNNELRNTYSSAKYNLNEEKSKTKTAELKAIKNEAEADRNMFFALFILFGFVLSVIFLRNRHKKNTIKKQFETEQQISKKLHDMVANDVFHAMQKAQDEDTNREQLVDDLEIIYKKTRDLSKANTDINVSGDFGQLLQDLIISYQINNVNIFTDSLFEVPWDVISKNKKKVLYRVVQELMTNMQKHSFADLVSFHFEKKGSKIIAKYADNGVGSHFKKGNGLQNVESRIKMVNGSVTFESEINNGFHVQIIV